MMEWNDTANSSNIARVGYDPETQEMQIEFRSGGSYAYSGVSSPTAADLAASQSPGSYFQRWIRNKYSVRKL